MKQRWSRRDLLRRSAAVGAVAAIPAPVLAQAASSAPYVHLTAAEAATLEAIVARLIPSDSQGGGALEAGAVRYIDGALGNALAAQRPAYAAGLAAVDAHARTSAGTEFAALTAEQQDGVLADIEGNRAAGFTQGSAAFFELVLGHTLEGTFGDPYYGGNQNYLGWEMLGYPGLRLAVTADQQRMNAALEPDFRSAYDHAMFDAHTTNGERDDD